jgi:hypothetical protein
VVDFLAERFAVVVPAEHIRVEHFSTLGALTDLVLLLAAPAADATGPAIEADA